MIINTSEKEKLEMFLLTSTLPAGMSKDQKKIFIRRAKRFAMRGSTLVHINDTGNDQLVIADDDQEGILKILNETHLPDHCGISVMWTSISARYSGFGRDHVEKHLRSCSACQYHLPFKTVDQIQSIVVRKPWERIQIDCVDMRKYASINDGYSWMLNAIDCYSKFLFCFAMLKKTADEVVNSLQTIIWKEGAPAIIQSDNGKEFINSKFSTLCARYNIQHIRGRPRHPQSQGQIERANQTIVRKIAKCLHGGKKRWIDKYMEIVAKYNLSKHRATNVTPMEAFRNRRGFNLMPAQNIDEDENATIETNHVSSEGDELIADFDEVDFDNVSNHLVINETHSTIISQNNLQLTAQTNISVIDPNYVDRYTKRTIEHASVHYHKLTFFAGDRVLLKKDFDNNLKTKKQKLDGFFESDVWTVMEGVGLNFYKIKKKRTNE
jgi:hypothetical protein